MKLNRKMLLPWVLPALLVAACGDDEPTTDAGTDAGTTDSGRPDSGTDAGTDAGPGNLVEVATNNGLTDLVSAAATAGQADALATGGPFTVFAPTNAAFANLGSAAPTDPDLLANVLLHHVVAGTEDSGAVLAAEAFTTLAKTSIAVDANALTIGGAPLSGTLDVLASNGIVHVIDEVMIPPRIDQAVAATADLSTLGTAVGAASQGVQDTLSGPGPITVFAPINSAFAAIPAEDLAALLADQEALDDLLTYHAAVGQTLSTDLSDGQKIGMANGDMLTVSVTANGVTLTDGLGNTVNVIETDIRLLNGTVHLIDGVLFPPIPNLVDVAADNGLDTLLSVATTAGLADTLANGGPFTVFAPTDAAFAALGNAAPTDPDLLANVLLAHVVPGVELSAAVLAAASFESAAKVTLAVDAQASPPRIGGARLSSTLDQVASNGVVHVIDDVIIPPTIVEAVVAVDDLSTLEVAVGAASQAISDVLSAPTAKTVFAPINSAFDAIPTADLNALLADQPRLDNILSYHVAEGQALSSDLSDGQQITMANGITVTVNIDSNGVTLTDGAGNTANVIETDIRLLNGTVHLIDGVLNPGDITEVAAANGSFTSLLGALEATGLTGALRGPGPFTVFAPSDTAFAALGDISGVSSDVIANILLHHVVAGEQDSSAVVAASSFATLAKTSLAIDASGSPITIGGGDLSATLDVGASNGIIHVMDDVIVPPTIVEVAVATPDLSSLVTAVTNASAGTQMAVMPNTLGGAAPITVFAPTNQAFIDAGIDPANTPAATLDAVLAHHVVSGQVLSTDLASGAVPTLNGNITVNVSPSGITITDGAGNTVNVIATLIDIRTLTGVVHVIDGVLLPAP